MVEARASDLGTIGAGFVRCAKNDTDEDKESGRQEESTAHRGIYAWSTRRAQLTTPS
jgi:hypothetical protein